MSSFSACCRRWLEPLNFVRAAAGKAMDEFGLLPFFRRLHVVPNASGERPYQQAGTGQPQHEDDSRARKAAGAPVLQSTLRFFPQRGHHIAGDQTDAAGGNKIPDTYINWLKKSAHSARLEVLRSVKNDGKAYQRTLRCAL